MKNYITGFILLGTLLIASACNEEWKEEVYRKEIGLKAQVNSEGVTNVYLPYEENGEFVYQLPVIAGGSTVNGEDLDIHIAVDPDTLIDLNEARWKLRTDLYYQELKEQFYEFPSPVCRIQAGESVGLFDIKFKLKDLDLREKWVLPLTIVDDHSYVPNPRKNYRKALLRVMPYNDYSGSYSATGMQVYMEGNKDQPISISTRNLYVVDEKSCFFYAGIISEELVDREKYKVKVTFHADGSLTLRSVDLQNKMNFQPKGTPRYETTVIPDKTIPYLEHHYTTVYIEYTYNDVSTYEGHLISYEAKGSMVMERMINPLVPERDQIQW